MNITNAQYQSLKTDDVVVDAQHGIIATINGVKMFVPMDENNRHYAEILKQVEDKTLTIADAD